MTKKTENLVYEKIKSKLEKIIRRKYLKHVLLLVHSDRLKIHWKFACGITGVKGDQINADNPYHIASIGKTFTSMLIAKLFEKGMINYDDPISKFMSSEILEGLFAYRGIDYSKEVLVRHLLNHTSGIADYYEDKPVKGKTIKELLVEDPERFWKPDDTISYSRDNQRVHSIPGKNFHYSDTGYNLLGKIIEKITDKTLQENLHTEIFDPLGMVNSYLLFYSKPKEESPYQIAETFVGNHEVSTFKSISIDWAGGGIVSTMEDLLLFQKALVNNTLIKKETFEICSKDLEQFGFGMDYGYGLLFLNVGKMTFILPKTLNMWGNFGSIGAYMFYNPTYDVYVIGSFNHSYYRVKQVIFVIDVIRKISKQYG